MLIIMLSPKRVSWFVNFCIQNNVYLKSAFDLRVMAVMECHFNSKFFRVVLHNYVN